MTSGDGLVLLGMLIICICLVLMMGFGIIV